ncbi:5413_t:CDS:2 [Paraglomus occultum]|uniref:5413_t:CDS:1 n=1 Tax=Paraglomus occultum TaxID=144539 RepID=A0A9N8Z4K9_9GLOM|nr:5413_t:CDS:2 [Paraglomus occultum]
MTHLISKIEALLLEEPLDSLCGASAVYLTIENNILPSLKYVRGAIDRAVNSSLLKMDDVERKTKVFEVLSQVGKKSDSAISIFNDESMADANFYGALKQILMNTRPSSLTWKDPEASMVLSDTSDIVKNLGRRQRSTFLEPKENMKCVVQESVIRKCDEFYGFAIEVQGKQHEQHIKYFHKNEEDFEKQLMRDQIKKELCEENWVVLRYVWYYEDPYLVIPDHLRELGLIE